jgi:TRAP transporter TAXI family solute receptor
MKMRKSKLFVSSMVLLAVGILLYGPAPVFSSEMSDPKLPDTIGMATLRVGSAAHVMATALGEIFKEKTQLKMKVIPSGGGKAMMSLVRGSSVQFWVHSGSSMYDVQFGLTDFAVSDWGPQPIQMAWLGPAYVGMVTTKAHKDINSVADIKGKRVGVPQHSATVKLVQSFLAFGGLTWQDVVAVPLPGYTHQFKALMAGKIDVAPVSNPLTATLLEVEASPGGLKWIPFPHDDREGWKRLQKISPQGVPGKVTIGPGLSEEKPLEAFMHAYAIVAYESQNPELVYLMTKTIDQNLKRLHAMAAPWKVYTQSLALRTEGYPHVYHRGAVKYFKEKGLWTSEHEKWNRQQLEIQRKMKDAWKSTLEQASAEKWKPEKLRKEWEQRQTAITGYEVPVLPALK